MNAIVKQFITYILLAMSFFMPGKMEPLEFTAPDTVGADQVVAVEFKNTTRKACYFSDYTLYYFTGDDWVVVQNNSNASIDSSKVYKPTEKDTVKINLSEDFGRTLPSGYYRIYLTYKTANYYKLFNDTKTIDFDFTLA